MLETLDVHIPIDRRIALSTGEALPSEVVGSVLFADIAGFSRMNVWRASGFPHWVAPRRMCWPMSTRCSASCTG